MCVVCSVLLGSVVAFEPMPANEWALRSTLCANADLSQRITFVPKGLGSSEQVHTPLHEGPEKSPPWLDGIIGSKAARETA